MKKVVLILGMIGIAGISACNPKTISKDSPTQLPSPPAINPDLINTRLDADRIKAIDDPVYMPASQVTDLQPDERILGVIINGEARAYPIPLLSVHEIVNDTIGGEPVAITWCPLCFSAIVFSRKLTDRDKPLTFAISGKLLYNTLVMFDRETNSLWSQLYGGAIQGELTGKSLAIFPSQLTTWEAWQANYPETLLLDKEATCRQFNCSNATPYQSDPYESYYASDDAGIFDYQIPRDIDPDGGKQKVLGIRLGAQSVSYPLEFLAAKRVLNDKIAGIPILIWYNPETETAAVYNRQMGEEILTFVSAASGFSLLIDEQSGSKWQGSTGVGNAGKFKGQQLTPIPATITFAFGWHDYFPNSETRTENR